MRGGEEGIWIQKKKELRREGNLERYEWFIVNQFSFWFVLCLFSGKCKIGNDFYLDLVFWAVIFPIFFCKSRLFSKKRKGFSIPGVLFDNPLVILVVPYGPLCHTLFGQVVYLFSCERIYSMIFCWRINKWEESKSTFSC